MSKQHTPGPWYMGTYTDHKPDADRGDWCGEIYSKEGKIYHGPFSFNALPNEANARLIAAAPDLLRALEHIEKVFIDTCDSEGFCDRSIIMDELDEYRRTWIDAIAKARGER